MARLVLLVLAQLCTFTLASWYDEAEIDWNLNVNKDAANPLEYFVPIWENHTYEPSPQNWRFPFYGLMLDRYVNGDPTNDDANGTAWEHDLYGTQLRHGGDMKGLHDSLDYIHGLGIRGLYLAGSVLINLPWEADSYSPTDLTILDHHFGIIEQFREIIMAIHDRGMYVMLDNTFSTMSDLFAFEGYYNTSAPWSFTEHNMEYKTDIHYRDFSHSNNYQEQCPFPYPRFWNLEGHRIDNNATRAMTGCMDSDFDQYGDVAAFGIYPEWQKQLSKFNGVQDRLRDWKPSVLDKINHFSCMLIQGLDIDGFRMDKGMQITVDSQANFSAFQRQCAADVGKMNFFIAGEIVNGNADGAIYIGRGKEPHMAVSNVTKVAAAEDMSGYIRGEGYSGFDAAAFHYTTYRSLERFLGLDGNFSGTADAPVDFQSQWRVFMQTNDMRNAITGAFDPRHMYGVSNQDVFRWPGLADGTERQLLGDFIVTLTMPGIPLVSWGEEQAFYTLDNTAANYVYGRQSMSSAQAWQMHGCNKVGDVNLHDIPFNRSLTACQDDSVSLDHRDASHPVYGVMKHMFELRRRYPVLNDGWTLRELSSHVTNTTLPYSAGVNTTIGLWSVLRGRVEGVQDLSSEGTFGNQGVWLFYSNDHESRTYTGDCNGDDGIISPFVTNTTVRNLFYPFDEWHTEDSSTSLGIEGSTEVNGCLPELNMTKYGWKAMVPVSEWTRPSPTVTRFLPGHDARVLSNATPDEAGTVEFEFRFSDIMDCDSFKDSFNVASTTETGKQARLEPNSLRCLTVDPMFESYYYGPSPTIWRAHGTLENVYDGIHVLTSRNVSNQGSMASTQSTDNFILRIGQSENPIVFPKSANYSRTLLFENEKTKRDKIDSAPDLYINHKAAGADLWRFSLSFGAIWSSWMTYIPGNASLPAQEWTGLKDQKWTGQHVQVQYWSSVTGSSDHIVEGDLVGSKDSVDVKRRFPHFFIHGPFNAYGFDSGIPNVMGQRNDSMWFYDYMTEWPAPFQLNVWGMDANGEPDVGYAFGDVDHDGVMERIAPTSLIKAVVSRPNGSPPSPHVAWRILFNDGDYRYYLEPYGSRWRQLALSIVLGIAPLITAIAGVLLYIQAFYGVKFNEIGISNRRSILPIGSPLSAMKGAFHRERSDKERVETPSIQLSSTSSFEDLSAMRNGLGAGAIVQRKKRLVLIGTMEYDITDWNIKVKIGGLGVIAQLMSKNLQHQDLVWVVPCVGDIEYPMDTPGPPIDVMILGHSYEVQTQYHTLDNITYMLLDAPVFRKQTQKEPYPARMDDLDSAIYYSAWNQCLAEAMRRFPIDLYHINDYHGTVAPLYLLPTTTVPCCLSLHNAEFQGLWPMRDAREIKEICSVFNLPASIVQQYVQFGEVFNLLHAGASILRIHQKGFGAVGVSKKYGKRSWARYPIFWGLHRIGALQNPDPSDVADWDRNEKLDNVRNITIDKSYESGRAIQRIKAQEWAGLEQRADADLFVFVGRWSMQKGIDLIADVFPAVLEQHPQTQLICVGPTIDMYGRFAALKLDKMMRKYPGRVYSKPEFTALPPFVFSGAEFALIPSRDEPFGLVAVEFGRKGALGVGSRVGGLGQMPGWWYTIESTSTKHQMQQFKNAISGALKSSYKTRALMRARSAVQRFPVAQWKQDLEILQSTAIKIHKKRRARMSARHDGVDTEDWAVTGPPPDWSTPSATPFGARTPQIISTPVQSRRGSFSNSPVRSDLRTHVRHDLFSLGSRHGPGHSTPPESQHRRGMSSLASRHHSHGSPTASEEHHDSCRDEELISSETAEDAERISREHAVAVANAGFDFDFDLRDSMGHYASQRGWREQAPLFSPIGTAQDAQMLRDEVLIVGGPPDDNYDDLKTRTPLSTETVMSGRTGLPQDLTPFFTDPTGLYYKTFDKMLTSLSGKTSENQLCIEEYLEKSEKGWFNRLHNAKMSRNSTPAVVAAATPAGSIYEGIETDEPMSQFLLPENYEAPTGLRRALMYKIGDWPLYTFLLGLGQILGASSYQITLLTGQLGETATQLYVVASIYIASTMIWWFVFRRFASRWCLSLPWLFYGLAWFFLGIAPYGTSVAARGWIQNFAIAMYAVASSSGSLFFAQNFGSSGAAPVRQWAMRACGIQGTQQLYVIGLWAFGNKLTETSAAGGSFTLGTRMTAIGMPVAVFLWAVGLMLLFGLPSYYRQEPGRTPDFYTAIFRRNIIVWFILAVFVQNIFLSAQYGRTWTYLWSSHHAPSWAIFLLVVFFFVFLWAIVLYIFSHLSATHSWILPLFAVGLLCPRWAQELWACSGIGSYLPWAGSPLASALVGRSLFLWLGLLDTVQNVGVGMLLLQTLARFHITFALMLAQVVGSVGTIIARADGLNSVGPGPVFPNLAVSLVGLENAWFWIAVLSQIAIAAGYFAFFRKEQLTKP